MNSAKISIDSISGMGQPPPQFVELAAKLGCDHVGLGLMPLTANPHNFTPWALHMDAQLRRDTKQALTDHGLSVAVCDGFFSMPNGWMVEPELALDAFCELGAARAIAVNLDADESRAIDRLAAFAELARGRGVQPLFEFLADQPFGTARTAADLARKIDGLQIVVDLLHLVRSGGGATDLAMLDPDVIGYVQVCDGTLARVADYGDEGANQRISVGKGEFPILEMLNALPRERVFGIEMPLRDKAEAGVSLFDALKPNVDATRALLAQRT